jgi:hypothetical protein
VVAGYDDKTKTVRLNDPALGRIKQTYDNFLQLWNVAESDTRYWLTAFNVANHGQRGKLLEVDLDQAAQAEKNSVPIATD